MTKETKRFKRTRPAGEPLKAYARIIAATLPMMPLGDAAAAWLVRKGLA